MPDRSVEELTKSARRRDAAAFACLIDRFERIALAVAWAAGAGGDQAGDVVQEAFCRAWENLPQLQQPQQFGSWLCRIVRNLAADGRRATRPEALGRVDEPVDVGAGGPLEDAARREFSAAVDAALAELDEISRCAVALRYYDGLSSRQIGELLEMSPSAVDMRLSRAREQLRARLGSAVDRDEQRSLT